jgi:hypothetical protein
MMNTRQEDATPSVSTADNNDQRMDTHPTTSMGSLNSVSNTVVNAGPQNTVVPTSEFNKLMKFINNLNLNNGPPTKKRPRDPQESTGPNKKGKPNISEANLKEYRHARNLRSKQEKYKVTSDALDKYLSHDDTIVPKGLEINVKPMIGHENTTFMDSWTNKVNESQRGLLTLQAEYCKVATHEYTNLADKAALEMQKKMGDDSEELTEAKSAIKTVATRVKATEYTKLQGKWSRDIGIHESRKMGITPPRRNQPPKNNGRRNNPNQNIPKRNNDRRSENQNRPTKVAKRRLPHNKGSRNHDDGVSQEELAKALDIVRAFRK